jgi:predicted nicotinamide N-methyase
MKRPHSTADWQTFIRASTKLLAPPLVPEIKLHLAEESLPIWQKTEEELGEMNIPPPYWAFAWAGGQALARYCLDRPALVTGKRVLDFASGSGLVAVAAAKAGAACVAARDIDAFAVAAIGLNAAANGVAIDARCADTIDTDEGWDAVFAGDICYERDMAARTIAWLARLDARGATVLIGDPGRSYLPRERLEALAIYEVPVTRALEDSDFKTTHVWRFRKD